MADVKLTPRETAQLLTRLDESLKSVTEARQQLISAMAERRQAPKPVSSASRAVARPRKRG